MVGAVPERATKHNPAKHNPGFIMSKHPTSFNSSATAKFAALTLFAVIALNFPPASSHAATLSWSGAGSSGNWSDSGNWGFAGTPATGDILVFPAAQPRLNNTNNIAGLTLNQIRFAGASGGYAIFGNAITVTNGIEATNTAGLNVVSNNITLGSTGDFFVDVATGAKLFLGEIGRAHV